MNSPHLMEKGNAYIWLCVGATLLIAISLIFNDAYMNLWIHTLLYGIIGFGNSAIMKEHPAIQKGISVFLLFVFIAQFISTGAQIGLDFGY